MLTNNFSIDFELSPPAPMGVADELIEGAIAAALPPWLHGLCPTVHLLRGKPDNKGNARKRIQVKFTCKCDDKQAQIWSCKGAPETWPEGVRQYVQDKHARCWEESSAEPLSQSELLQRLGSQTKLAKRKSNQLATVKANPPDPNPRMTQCSCAG